MAKQAIAKNGCGEDGDYDVAIIGAGIIGAAIYHRLASMGMRVVICDKTGIASGTTGKSGGLITAASDFSFNYYQQFQHQVGIALTQRQLRVQQLGRKQMPAMTIDTQQACHAWLSGATCLEGVAITQIVFAGGQWHLPEIKVRATQLILANASDVFDLLQQINQPFDAYVNSFQYLRFHHPDCDDIAYVEKDYFLIPTVHGEVIAGFFGRDKITRLTHIDEKQQNDLLALLPDYQAITFTTEIAYDVYKRDTRQLVEYLPEKNVIIAAGYNAGGIKVAPEVAYQVGAYLHSVAVDG